MSKDLKSRLEGELGDAARVAQRDAEQQVAQPVNAATAARKRVASASQRARAVQAEALSHEPGVHEAPAPRQGFHPAPVPDPDLVPVPAVPRAPGRMTRAERKPFGAHEQTLAHPPIPGYRLYWFSDKPGWIARAKQAGYEHVLDDEGKPLSRVVGRNEAGGGMVGYLMKIPQEWYFEDMDRAQADYAEKINAIKKGKTEQDVEGKQYVADRHNVQIR